MEVWAEDSPLPQVQLIWIDLPQDIPSPVGTFWAALTNLVKAAHMRGVPVILTVKHTSQRNGTWKFQSFRSWRNQFSFQHTKHCFCAYGLKLHNEPFHWKMNVLSSGITLKDQVCSHWSDGDSPLTAKDAQRLLAMERQFFAIACSRWCHQLTSSQDSGTCTLQPGPSEDEPLEAQRGPESVGNTEKAYPTDARERQKKREKLAKERGEELQVKKRKKFVEDHHDDCGEDISSIANEQDIHFLTVADPATMDTLEQEDSSYLSYMFWGSELGSTFKLPNTTRATPTLEEMCTLLSSAGPGIDIAELCGGVARPTTLAIRRRLKTGQNFDLVTNVDLNKPSHQNLARQYINNNQVLVVVMAPTCGPFGPMGKFNRAINPKSWEKSYQLAAPHGRFCGEIARMQLRHGRHFICEQPLGSDLYREYPWTQVLNHEQVVVQRYDRCMAGLRAQFGPNKGMFIKKSSTMTASDPVLVQYFAPLQCTNRHTHLQMKGDGKNLSACQVWTWEEANHVVSGICALKKQMGSPSSNFPVTRSTGSQAQPGEDTDGQVPPQPRGRDPRAPPMEQSQCVGCKHRRARDDPSHSRQINECSYPYDEPRYWKCPGCQHRKPRSSDEHTYIDGECRLTVAAERQSAPRRGHEPRNPRRRASDDPTANLDPADIADPPAASSSAGQSSGVPPQPGQAASSSSDPAGGVPPPPGRGPDAQQRVRRTYEEQATGPPNPSDWVSFDVGNTLRAIRSGNVTARRRLLRKLHLRWWHANLKSMTTILGRAGLPREILDLVPDIIDTCAVCRKWMQPLPDSVASVSIPDAFNQQVECDILFVYQRSVMHFLDRCTRWHSAIEIPDKTEDSFMTAIHRAWITTHGPMKELIMDGERSVAESFRSKSFLARLGITLTVRAPDQHARYVERRGKLLRDVIHRIDGQLQREGLTEIPFEFRLSEAVFAGNALVSVNNTTPYNAVYGRVPRLLPDINQSNSDDAPADSDNVSHPGLLRHTHRLREIAVQQMVEGTARARLGRALKTKTLAPGEVEEYQVGEEVDYHRPPNNKDISGWTGPAVVTDLTLIPRGLIGVRHQGRNINCRVGDVRRHLSFLSFEAAVLAVSDRSLGILPTAKCAVERVPEGTTLHLGYTQTTNNQGDVKWRETSATSHKRELFETLLQFASQCLNLEDCVAVRLAKGCGTLPSVRGYTGSLLLWWHPNASEHMSTYEFDSSENFQVRQFLPDSWKEIRILQFLQATDPSLNVNESAIEADVEQDQPAAENNHPVDPPPEQRDARERNGTLTPIMEESTQPTETDSDPSEQLFTHEDPNLLHAVSEAYRMCLLEAEDYGKSNSCSEPNEESSHEAYLNMESHTPTDFKQIVHNYHIIAANARAGIQPNYGCDEEPDKVEIHYSGDAAKLVYDRPRAPRENEVLVQEIYLSGARRTVVQRDDDILTAEELRIHAKEVAASMLSELKTWAKLKCFSRRKRAGAKNIIDCRWVIKWKYEQATTSVDAASSSTTAKTEKRRVIRSRLTVRGFKDRDAHNLDSYAGTSQRYSQRLVCSEAAHRGWPICTTDISKAFLQGVTYEELAELTGEPIREVNFYLPAHCNDILRQVPGFEDFDEGTEILHCDKPGTGLVDAPRAFSLKLSQVTKGQCRMVPSTVDAELVMKYENNQLLCLMAKHVDDLKLAGERGIILKVLKLIQDTFGELKIEWHNFTNCGLRHIQDPQTFSITLDQEMYVQNIKPIIHDDLKGKSSDKDCSPELAQLFMSLLGAVAYALMTRVDVAVFVCALQRVTHKPKIIHIKRLNAVLRWMQANPKRLTFRSAKGPSHLRCVGDAAFKREEEAGHSLRGALFLRSFGGFTAEAGSANFATSTTVHIVDAICKSQRHVTRSTFSSELLSACDTVDHGMLLALSLHEFSKGPQSTFSARQLREFGGWDVKLGLYVDAMSVYAAVTATFIKIPAEKSLLSHVQYLRELLDTKVLEALIWIDTRDMVADGLTKGAVERAAIHACMNGKWDVIHEAKVWKASKQMRPRHLLPS